MSGMKDYAFSIKMRDTIIRLAEEVVNRLRPSDRYGIVDSIDLVNRKAGVILTGDATPVIVNMGVLVPISVGQKVRISGTTGDKFISDIFGGAYFDQVNASILRATSTTDLSLSSTDHGFQVGPSSGLNLGIDQNEIMARSNGATSSLYLNLDGGIVSIGVGGLTTTGALAAVSAIITGLMRSNTEVVAGTDAGLNMRMNTNQVRALNNGAVSSLHLNYGGGDLYVANSNDEYGIIAPGNRAYHDHVDGNISYSSSTFGGGSSPSISVMPFPASGKLIVSLSARVPAASGNAGVFGFELRSDGGGTTYLGASDQRSVINSTGISGNMTCGKVLLVTGLPTSGNLEIEGKIRCSGGSSLNFREMDLMAWASL